MPDLTSKEKKWRVVKKVVSWDQADSVRIGIMRDSPSIDVRIRSEWGNYVVEVCDPVKR